MVLRSPQRDIVRGERQRHWYPMKTANFCYQIGGLLWRDFFFFERNSRCGRLNWRFVKGHIFTDWSSGNFWKLGSFKIYHIRSMQPSLDVPINCLFHRVLCHPPSPHLHQLSWISKTWLICSWPITFQGGTCCCWFGFVFWFFFLPKGTWLDLERVVSLISAQLNTTQDIDGGREPAWRWTSLLLLPPKELNLKLHVLRLALFPFNFFAKYTWKYGEGS